MIVIAASCPSNRLAAVTNRTGFVGGSGDSGGSGGWVDSGGWGDTAMDGLPSRSRLMVGHPTNSGDERTR